MSITISNQVTVSNYYYNFGIRSKYASNISSNIISLTANPVLLSTNKTFSRTQLYLNTPFDLTYTTSLSSPLLPGMNTLFIKDSLLMELYRHFINIGPNITMQRSSSSSVSILSDALDAMQGVLTIPLDTFTPPLSPDEMLIVTLSLTAFYPYVISLLNELPSVFISLSQNALKSIPSFVSTPLVPAPQTILLTVETSLPENSLIYIGDNISYKLIISNISDTTQVIAPYQLTNALYPSNLFVKFIPSESTHAFAYNVTYHQIENTEELTLLPSTTLEIEFVVMVTNS